MHPRALNQRLTDAETRIQKAARKLAKHADFDAEPLLTTPWNADPQITRLQEREATADLLEAVADKITAAPAKADRDEKPPPAAADRDEKPAAKGAKK